MVTAEDVHEVARYLKLRDARLFNERPRHFEQWYEWLHLSRVNIHGIPLIVRIASTKKDTVAV